MRRLIFNSGIHQGGVIPPTLFAVFINGVLESLEASGLCCIIKNMCFNSFVHADDLLLLTISIKDLQCMLDIYFSELCWLDMSVNIKKSQCIRIGLRFNAVSVMRIWSAM